MALREPQRNLEKTGQHMHVFVAVEVCRRNSRVAHFLICASHSFLHFRQRESAPRPPQQKALGSARKCRIVV